MNHKSSSSSSSLSVWNVPRGGGSIDHRYFIAGGTCAAISHGITTPIDVVKTRMQSSPEKYNQGMIHALTFMVREEGVGVLLAGLGPTVIGYAVEGAMKFGVYEVSKPFVKKIISNTNLAFIVASVVAGAVAAVLLCPMEGVRIRVVTDDSYKNMSTLSSLMKLVQEEGFGVLFGGLYAMLAKQVPYTMGKQVSFDLVAGLLYTLLAAFVASIFACITSQPGDMILTATYKGATDQGF